MSIENKDELKLKSENEIKQENLEKTAQKNLENEGFGKDFLKEGKAYADEAIAKKGNIETDRKAEFDTKCSKAKNELEQELLQIANEKDLNKEERQKRMNEAFKAFNEAVDQAYIDAMPGAAAKRSENETKEAENKTKDYTKEIQERSEKRLKDQQDAAQKRIAEQKELSRKNVDAAYAGEPKKTEAAENYLEQEATKIFA